MKVLQVVSGLSPQSGGPTRSVKGLCRALSMNDVDVSLLVLNGHHPFEDPCGCRVAYGEGISVTDFDIVHLHGLWDLKLHAVVSSCRKNGVPYVVSPRGMLDPWALSVKRLKKFLGMAFYQRKDLMHAAAFHATAREEAEHIRAQGLNQSVFIAPNGVEVPREMPTKTAPPCKTAVFLSRLHPGKGLLLLADAWAKVRPVGWRMKVVGPDSYGHKKDVVRRLDELGITSQWDFIDMVDDVQKWVEYRSAQLLVHPSVSENFGITIAEGLYAELPVICTKGTPWAILQKEKCGWWIDQGVDALSVALAEATGLPSSVRAAMGEKGRTLIEREYMWSAIALRIKAAYSQVLFGDDDVR